MAERSEVLRVQNDALLNEYHNLIGAQVRRIDEALAVLDHERRNLLVEKEHLLRHLPPPVNDVPQGQLPTGREKNPQEMSGAKQQDAMPKFLSKGPAT